MRALFFPIVALFISCSAIDAAEQQFGELKVSQTIDQEILAVLANPPKIKGEKNTDKAPEKITPASLATDAEFVRRVYLDLLGRVPTIQETKAYLADTSAEKSHRLINQLLAHPEMPMYWREVINVWMNGRSPEPPFGDKEFRAYLEKCLAENRPWDKMARDLVLPPQEGPYQPAAFFLARRLRVELKEDQLDGMTVAVASIFFGVRMECAKCHDHPYVDEWKQEHYYGLASFLNRTEAVNANPRIYLREKDSGEVTYQTKARQTMTGKLLFLDNHLIEEPKAAKDPKAPKNDKKDPTSTPSFSRRKALADYAFVPSNPYFKKAVVNRVWKQLLGTGLVEPVDQIHSANPSVHPKVLELLSEDFAKNGFDLKRLMGNILHTDAYRRSSIWTGKDRPASSLFAVANLKPLTPEQLALSLSSATGYDEVIRTRSKKTDPSFVRAEVEKDFRLFVENYDTEADNFSATTAQALFITYNKASQKYLAPVGTNLVARLVRTSDKKELTREAFLAVLSREPSQAEIDDISAFLDTKNVPKEQLCKDIIWALITTSEFRFNH